MRRGVYSPPVQPLSDATRAWWSYERPATYEVVGHDRRRPGARRGHDRVRAPSSGPRRRRPSTAASRRSWWSSRRTWFSATSTSVRPTSSRPRIRRAGRPSSAAWVAPGGGGTTAASAQCGPRRPRPDRVARGQPSPTAASGCSARASAAQTSYSAAVEGPEHLVAIAPDAVALVALPRRRVPGRHQVDRARRDRQLARHRQPDQRRRGRRRCGVRREPRAPHVRRVLARPVVRRPAGVDLDPRPRDRRLERRVLPLRHHREHRGASRIARGRSTARGGHFFPVALGRRPGVVDDDGDARGAGPGRERRQLPSGVLLAWFDHWVAGARPTSRSRRRRRSPRSRARPASVPAGGSSTAGTATGGTGQLDARRSLGRRRDAVDLRPAGRVRRRRRRGDVHLGAARHGSRCWSATRASPSGRRSTRPTRTSTSSSSTSVPTATRRGSTTGSSPPATGVRTPSPSRSPSARPPSYRVADPPPSPPVPAGHRVRVRVGGGAPSKLTAPPAPVTVTMETGGTVVLRLPGFSRGSVTVDDLVEQRPRVVAERLRARSRRSGGTPRSPRRSRLGVITVVDVVEAVGRALVHELHGHLRAEAAVGVHDRRGRGQPRWPRSARVRRRRRRGRAEAAGEDAARRGSPATRRWSRSGTSGGRRRRAGSSARRSSGHGVAVDHREEERRRRRPDDRGHVEPVEPPVLELGQEVVEVAGPVPVLALAERRSPGGAARR